MRDPTVTWTKRLSHRWFPSREARHRRRVQMAVFLTGIVFIVLAFELMRMGTGGNGTIEQTWLSGTAPWGFLLLFVGAAMSLIGFGYLASPLKPWQIASDEYGDIRSLPSASSGNQGAVAQQARVLFILLLAVGLLLIEAIPLYNFATRQGLFDRSSCVSNCNALTLTETAFLLDLLPIAIANAFIVIMLFVFIQP